MSEQNYTTVPDLDGSETVTDDCVVSDETPTTTDETVQIHIGGDSHGSGIVWKASTLSVYDRAEFLEDERTGCYLIGESTNRSRSGWSVDDHRSYIPNDTGAEGWFITEQMFEDNEELLEPFLESYDSDTDTAESTDSDTVTILRTEWDTDTLKIYPDPVVDDGHDVKGAYFITGKRVGGESTWDPKNRTMQFPNELGSDVRHMRPHLADECDVDLEPYTVDEWDGGNRQDE